MIKGGRGFRRGEITIPSSEKVFFRKGVGVRGKCDVGEKGRIIDGGKLKPHLLQTYKRRDSGLRGRKGGWY